MKTEMDNVSYLNQLKKEIEDTATFNQWLSECQIFLCRIKTDSLLKDSVRRDAERLLDSLGLIADNQISIKK